MSRTPLWTVDWYAHSVVVFSDGVHVIRYGWWHFNWERPDDTKFDETDHTFSVATISDEKYTFDYTTGEIISARRPLRAFFVLVAATALFLVLLRFYRR